MGSIEQDVYASARYMEPDDSITAEERCLYLFPAAKVVKDVTHKLHDIRTSSDIEQGPEGLDVQGFTYLKHDSALSGEQFYEGRNVEETYFPEMVDLICKVTGAKRAIVDGVAMRRRIANEETSNPYHVMRRGCDFDKVLSKLPRDVARGMLSQPLTQIMNTE